MKVASLSVGLPREVEWEGSTVLTSIFKEPVDRRLRVNRLNFEGDEQSDLTVHGGRNKAVYLYPSEHYEYWTRELGVDLPWGAFGENLTVEGILEEDVRIGDRLQIGSVEFAVTQPRMPCFKLGIRFDRDDMVRLFLNSGRSGIYLAVIREGSLAAGDEIAFAATADHDVTIADVAEAYASGGEDQNLLGRVVAVPTLPEGLRRHFAEMLERA